MAGGAGGAGCAVTPGNKRRILSELLAHFRLPFISTPSAFIAYREISLHAMRNQDLRARMDEVSRVHEEQLTSVVNALLTVHGARLLIEVEDLVAICIGCYHVAAETAVAVAPEAERVEVDTSRLLAVLIAFIRFPGEEGTETAGL